MSHDTRLHETALPKANTRNLPVEGLAMRRLGKGRHRVHTRCHVVDGVGTLEWC